MTTGSRRKDMGASPQAATGPLAEGGAVPSPAKPSVPSADDVNAWLSSPEYVLQLERRAAVLLASSTYSNAPHEAGRRVGYVVPDTDDVRLSRGCDAAKALQELARIAVANAASAIEAREGEKPQALNAKHESATAESRDTQKERP